MKAVSTVSRTGIILAAILYVAINLFINLSVPSVRLDLTEDSLFTLSKGSRTTLSNIDEPIEFHFFFSERLGREVPFYSSYGRRVRELLTEISAASNSKVILNEYKTESFSDDEDRAVSFGVQGIPLDEGGELAYFGLVGSNSVDDVELIPFFQPERETLLEYDVVQMIHSLSNPEPAVVGLMSSLPIMGDMQAQLQGGVLIPWAIANEMRNHFKLINLPEKIDSIPDEIGVMMIVHPRNMSDRSIYELEQFLFRGGRAILFIDPKAESDLAVGPDRISSSANGLTRLFKHWEIEVPEHQLVADRSMALRINAGTAAQPIPAEYLVWLGVSQDYMTQSDPVTSKLPDLNMATVGYIERKDESPLLMEPLIVSSTNSSIIDSEETLGLRPDIIGMLDKFKPDENQYVIAARLRGEVNTAFPDGPPEPIVAIVEPQLPQLKHSVKPINLVLVTDSDFLDERFWLRKQPFFGREVEEKIAGNADFVVNAIGNLFGSDELLKLRSRGVSQRPFDKIKALEKEAQRQYQDKERQLQTKLKETQTSIAELEGVRNIQDSVTGETKVEILLSTEQRHAVEILRQDMLLIRKQLREVQLSLRERVEGLESWLKFFNIGLVPIIVLLFAVVLWFIRAHRTRRKHTNINARGLN